MTACTWEVCVHVCVCAREGAYETACEEYVPLCARGCFCRSACVSVHPCVRVPAPLGAAKCRGRAGRQGACPAGFPHASSGAGGSKGLYALSGGWGLARVENGMSRARGPAFCHWEPAEVRA